MTVAGIGCRTGAAAEDILAAVQDALAKAGDVRLAALATLADKCGETGLVSAARRLGVPLIAVALADMQAVADRAVTRSARVADLKGVPSVAETAALAAAGDGARLIVARIIAGAATCAIATGGGDTTS
ncbi:MAG: cobalamin biosynthesis protein [Hyphomicrobiaceae bacterium]